MAIRLRLKSTSKLYTWINDLGRKLQSINGPGVDNKASAITINPLAARGAPIIPPWRGIPVIVTGGREGGGTYFCSVCKWKPDIDTDDDLDLSSLVEEVGLGAALINQGENGHSTHYIGTGSVVEAFPTSLISQDLLRVYITNFSHAIRDIRFNSSTGWIQATYNDNETVPEDDWVNKINTAECPTEE